MISQSLYYIFIVSFFLHMTARIPALGALRFDFLLMALISISIFFSQERTFDFKTSLPTKRLLIFILVIVLTTPLVGFPGSVIHHGLKNFSKVAAFFFFTVYLVDNEEKIKRLLFVFFASQSVRVFEPLYLHITDGYWGDAAYSASTGALSRLDRLSSGPFDVLNATQFGWLIVSVFVFYYYLLITGGKKAKLLFCIIGPPTIYTFLLTGARSGLLCLFVVFFLIIFFREKKSVGLIVGIIVMVLIVFFAAMELSPKMKTRYLSLVEKNVEGSDTASGRFTGLKKNFSTVWHRPVIGNGIGTTSEVNVKYIGSMQPSHNMYIEILQETGIVGLFLFLKYIKSMLNELNERRKKMIELSQRNWLLNLITALLVWMYMHLFYTLSCFSLNRWEWYFFGGLAVVTLRVSEKYVSEEIQDEKQIE